MRRYALTGVSKSAESTSKTGMRLPCFARRWNSRKSGWITGASTVWRIGGGFRAQRPENGATHDRFRSELPGPQFPLRDSLSKKHFDTGNGSDPLAGGQLQQLRALGPVDKVHDNPTVYLASAQRGNLGAGMHADRCGVEYSVEQFRAQSAPGDSLALDRPGKFSGSVVTSSAN